MNESRVIDIIYAINCIFRREWFKYDFLQLNISEQDKEVIDIFTNGGCAIYSKFLYDLFKDYGAILGKSNDHMFIKLGERYYDVVSGYRPNKEELQKSVDEFGFDIIDLTKQEDIEYYNHYVNDICAVSKTPKLKEAEKILDGIKSVIKDRISNNIENGEKKLM